MSAKFIVLNGKTYHSVEEMPPDVREAYELAMCLAGDPDENDTLNEFDSKRIFADRDKDGIPDILKNMSATNTVVNSMKIIVDGKEFDSVESLPPEARAKYEEAMGKLDANRNGIPDFVDGMIKPTNQTANVVTNFGAETLHATSSDYVSSARRDKTSSADSAITVDVSSGWTLALAGMFVLLLCAAGIAGVWYFFLR
ncbi:MAG TPA: hypothetical protein VHP14_07855 [Anaerolineales bacterium]|nr:hypothetical protein [Anaerolineales bacterium]